MRRWAWVLIAALLLAACGGGGDGDGGGDQGGEERGGTPESVPGDAVAVVGDTEISRGDYDNWARAAAANVPGGEKQEGEALEEQVMQFLLSSEWILQEAEARGIAASDEEVRSRFDDQKQQSFPKEEDYQEFLRTSMQTEDDLLFRVKIDLLSNKIRDEVTADAADPSDEDIQSYYEKNRKRFEGQSFEEARETIRNVLAAENEQKLLDEFVKEFRQRHREKTLCADDYVIADCSNSGESGEEEPAPPLFGPESMPGP